MATSNARSFIHELKQRSEIASRQKEHEGRQRHYEEVLRGETGSITARLYECITGLREQTDELAYVLIERMLKEREQEHEQKLRLKEIEELLEEVIDGGALEYKGAKVSKNSEVEDMMDDIFDGDGSGGEALSEIPGELKDEVTTPEDLRLYNELCKRQKHRRLAA